MTKIIVLAFFKESMSSFSLTETTSHAVTADLSSGGGFGQSLKTRLISYDYQQWICVLYQKGFSYTGQ